ncbi:MAG: hypothetical protein FWD17_18520, partial [Polyangiaceae bacterium]|nr:hypothetical protein [Polyangiaceae bacterium]
PCSIGFAGRHAADQSLAINVGGTTGTTSGTALVAVSERVLGVPATVQCVQNFAAAGAGVSYYPISRKLYLNSTIGFQNVTTAEQALAGCENTSALVNQAVAENFFVPLPPTLPDGGPSVNGGLPFCEDFNEEMLCAPSKGYPYAGDTAAGGNVNACPTFASTFNIGNGTQTTCGNGIVEQFEDCDFGTQGIGADGGVIYQADGGLVNGATVDSTGKAVPPGTGCSSICRKQ